MEKKIELKNVALWCKGWYMQSPKVKDWWKELAVCIANDGWVVPISKRWVAKWIINRLDENYEFFKKCNNAFGIGFFYDEVQKRKDWDSWSRHPEGLDDEDAIILVFRSLMFNANGDWFSKSYYPTPNVLPINLSNSYIDDKGWHAGEMMSEWKERVHEKYPDWEEQTLKPYERWWTLEDVEERIKK